MKKVRTSSPVLARRPKFDPANTVVIADFDGTITRKKVGEVRVTSTMGLLLDKKYLSADSIFQEKELFATYYPIETNPHMSEAEKTPLMQEWWEKSYQVLIDHGLRQEIIQEICYSTLLQPREGLLAFLQYLHENQIPLIIFSATGLGKTAITHFLQRFGALTPNISLFANDLVFDEMGVMTGYQQPIVHIANKMGSTLVANHILDQRPSRRQCLVLGDSLDDAKMSQGIDFELVYKVAFVENHPEHFAKLFDLVLDVEAGYENISRLFVV